MRARDQAGECYADLVAQLDYWDECRCSTCKPPPDPAEVEAKWRASLLDCGGPVLTSSLLVPRAPGKAGCGHVVREVLQAFHRIRDDIDLTDSAMATVGADEEPF